MNIILSDRFCRTPSLRRQLACLGIGTALVFICSMRAQGQPASETTQPAVQKAAPATAQTHPNNPELWDVDQMMEEAVLQISRRYNLNKAQEEYTRSLLVARTRAFLEVHESDVRELLKESIDLRLGVKAGTPEVYMKWAIRALPIYQAAQNAILEGNEEWGAILDDDQKKIHLADMSLMRTNFTTVTKTLDDWKGGKGPAATIVSGNPPPNPQGNTGVVTKGQVSDPQPGVMRNVPEDSWLAYVNQFIQTYGLDEKQANAAREKIHKEYRERAIQYREKKKSEFEKVDAESKSINPTIKPAEIARRKADLEKPLQQMFIELDERLFTLPNSRQLAAVEPDKKKMLDTIYAVLSGRSRDKAGDAKSPPTPSRSEEMTKAKVDNRAREAAKAPAAPPTSQPAATTQPSR